MSLSAAQLAAALRGHRQAERAAAALARHHAELERWNRTHNLTRVAGEEALERHYLDAVRGFGLLEQWYGAESRELPARVVDVGSGAGFPGLVGALLWPDSRFTLLDASAKRCSFLRFVLGILGVEAQVLQARAEGVKTQWPLLVSRATVQPGEAKGLLKLVAPGGIAALWVGERAEMEGAEVLEAAGTRVAVLRST